LPSAITLEEKIRAAAMAAPAAFFNPVMLVTPLVKRGLTMPDRNHAAITKLSFFYHVNR
jgi:hypothetical protein